MTAFECEQLTPDQMPELLDLWKASGLGIRAAGRERPDILRREMEAYPNSFIGAFENGQMVGAVIASWDGRRGWINRLAVDPGYRRRGVAEALIRAGETELERCGALVIAALIEPDNAPSLNLFRKSGYLDAPGAIYLSKRRSLDV